MATEVKEMEIKQEKTPSVETLQGNESTYIKLISKEGHEFVIKREYAMTSEAIKNMLTGPGQFVEQMTNEVNLREISSRVLEKICLYFLFKHRYGDGQEVVPEFPIEDDLALDVLMAANFLCC